MKKALLIAAAVMFVASSVFAGDAPNTYIGLFKDITHFTDYPVPPLPQTPNPGNSVCTTASFYCWIWVCPGTRGFLGGDFCLTKPASAEGEIPVIDIIVQVATINSGITAPLGDLWTGMSVTFSTCQTDWVWLYNLRMRDYSDESPVIGTIEVVPHPATEPLPALQLVNCNMDLEPFVYLTPLYLCPQPEHPLSVQESNWGAIKSLF
jgi:hypothetical protein